MSDKLRVLATGASVQQIGRPNRLKYRTVASYLKTMLEDADCEVDMRQVVPGEDLRKGEYDVALVGLNSPRGLPARFLYGSLHAMNRAREECGGRLAFYIDDWQFSRYAQQARSQYTRPDNMFDDHKRKCRVHVDEALEIRDQMLGAIWAMGNRPWPLTLYPAYPGGDPAKMLGLPARESFAFNPNPWAIEHAEEEAEASWRVPDEMRERRHINASLVAHEPFFKRMKATWPITSYGAKIDLPGVESPGQLPELGVREHYARAWSVLSPHYRISGSGWWRVRALHSVVAGAVWLGDTTEMAMFGPEWAKTTQEVEALSDWELRDLADAQASSLRAKIGTKHEAAWALRKSLESAYI